MERMFTYHICGGIPLLGWSMVINKDCNVVDVYCGNYVERNNEWFVSGVWDGEFGEADFSSAEFFCATGAKIINGNIVVYSPTHERQRICYIEKEKSIIFSNSIPLLLATANEEIDKNCDQYEKILCSILWGTKEYTKDVPIANNRYFKQIFCADVTIDSDLQVYVEPKKIHRDFKDFKDYYDSITSVCDRISKNGLDEKRIRKYEMAATASSGYDSSCCAAILKKVGCNKLFTFKGGYYDDDSAVTIAKQLGFENIIERDYFDYKEKTKSKDAEFYVCGDIGVYMQFSSFEDDFSGHIISIGTSGSYIWDKEGNVNPESKRSGYDFYTANLSFSENALIKGYIILPLPLYGSTAVQSIQKISNMPEMKEWTLGTKYDRPICRRILETSGVDGRLFGHKKYGAGFALSKNFTLNQIKPKMSKEGYVAFVNWLNEKSNNQWTIQRYSRLIQYHFANIPVYIGYILSKMHISNSLGKESTAYPNPGIPAKLIVWGMEVLTKRYGAALRIE